MTKRRMRLKLGTLMILIAMVAIGLSGYRYYRAVEQAKIDHARATELLVTKLSGRLDALLNAPTANNIRPSGGAAVLTNQVDYETVNIMTPTDTNTPGSTTTTSSRQNGIESP